MVKPISEYTKEELEVKRKRTAETLRKYEEELERREREAPLGVPSRLKSNMYYFLNSKNEVAYPSTIDNKWDALDRHSACNVFDSYKSAEKHSEMLLDWRKALVANAKGEPIDIQVLLPLLNKGYVAMDENKRWYWFKHKPTRTNTVWTTTEDEGLLRLSNAFNIKPAEYWRESLMECGL